ncbi:MAG: hypothetical protein DI534_11915 [Leifsonia xyli]|nr:MAG: hypothetical protein DI534_11915 [Leifsonia xyli]
MAALAARLGIPPSALDAEDRSRAEAALEDATVLALAEAPYKDEAWRVNAPAVVSLIVLKAARREFENPRGISQEAQGEGSVSLTDTSGVYLTAREVQQLRRAARGTSRLAASPRTPSAYE